MAKLLVNGKEQTVDCDTALAKEALLDELAVHEIFHSVVGQGAEVSYRHKELKVHKVWCVVHCGKVPTAPAVANALFKLTKKRVRTLPFVEALA